MKLLDSMELSSDTRFYASPNEHLIWTFYTGLPFQSLAPVRKSFLDAYPGDILWIDSAISSDSGLITAAKVEALFKAHGQPLTPGGVEQWLWLLSTRRYRAGIYRTVGGVELLEPIPQFAQHLLELDLEQSRQQFLRSGYREVIQGFDVSTWQDWRNVLMYRFVHPALHSGRHANYADRLRGSEAILSVPAGAAIYHSHWHPPTATSGVSFRFDR